MKKLLVSALAALTLAIPATADVGLDAASRYVWRGLLQDDGVALQPSLNIGTEQAQLGFWGSYGLNGGLSEINTSLSFNVLGYFNAALTDYYTTGPVLDFDGDSGTHQIEASVSCNQLYGTLAAHVMVFGPNGKDTYLEYGADLGWIFGEGVLDGLTASVGGGNGLYSSTGDFQVTTLGLGTGVGPLDVDWIVNVDTEDAWVVASWSL